MPDRQPMIAIPRGVIDVPVTLFTLDNKRDPATFAPVVEFLLTNHESAACADLHLAESLNLLLDTHKALAKCIVGCDACS